MRRVALVLTLLAGTGSPASAQAHATIDDVLSAAGVDLPAPVDSLVSALGQPWARLRPPGPDASAVGDGAWTWPGPTPTVDSVLVSVHDGLLESVSVFVGPDGPDLSPLAQHLYDRLGSPRPDGFYATDQTGLPFSLGLSAAGRRLDLRATPGQRADRP